MDYDRDVCYHVAAIDINKNLNSGQNPSKTDEGNCRGEDRMWHSNVYSRQR